MLINNKPIINYIINLFFIVFKRRFAPYRSLRSLMSADEYITLRVTNDLNVPYNREEKGDLCRFNTDCHPDFNCVNNTCQMWPATVVQWPGSTSIRNNLTTKSGQGSGNYTGMVGDQCLVHSDCSTNYCNGFTCMNKAMNISYPATSMLLSASNQPVVAPMMRCYAKSDCPKNMTCGSDYSCQ